MQVVGLTDRGKERPRNEDSLFARAEKDFALLAVADGMGGHRAGDVASAIAIETMAGLWDNLDRSVPISAGEAGGLLNKLSSEANERILDLAGSDPAKKGMGTTLTAGVISGRIMVIGHIGDSRAYLIRNNTIRVLTKDHSLLQQLISSGDVKPEEARTHPQRHILTRALGVGRKPKMDLFEVVIEEGSALLFCTDGLTGLVGEDEILSVFREEDSPQAKAAALIGLANSRGGYDNITVVIAAGVGGNHDE